jgi:hypothetical protein
MYKIKQLGYLGIPVEGADLYQWSVDNRLSTLSLEP